MRNYLERMHALLVGRNAKFGSENIECVQDGELASTVAQHSYNELVSLLVDRLGDEAALQSKPGSRPHTPTPETAAKEELPPGNAMVESEKHGELVQPSSASRVGQAEKQSIGQEETGPMSKAAEQEAPVHAMQVES